MLCPFPDCGRPLTGLGSFCHGCARYAADFRRDEPKSSRHRDDPRSEKEIQGACTNAWKALGFLVWNLSQPRATMQSEGLPDQLVIGRGLVLLVEYKSATGEQRDDQKRLQAAVEANGGRYLLIRHESEVIAWHEQLAA